MDKLEIINELRDQLGTWRFYYYSSSPDKAPKLYEGKSAKLVVCNLLNLSVSTAEYDEIISSFTRKIFAPANIFGSSTLNKNNLEELCTSLLMDLYYYKKIDPYLYYMWKFEGEGIYPFFFRGKNHDETMKSFRLNYKKALHINNDRITNSFDLMKRLNDAFLSLGFGMKGINLNEMISLNFVERVMLDELGNIHGTINRYKRWYYGEINRYERSY